MARLGSKKSRNGCAQCKARRVKCDELKPCGNCTRYSVECSLLHANEPPSRQPRTPSIGARSSTPSQTNDGASPSATRRARAPSSDAPSSQVPVANLTESWMQDLELMHHYTAHAYLTLPGVELAKQVWGYAVPQEAYNHSFLMHGILAFSAHHLAFLNPSRGNHYRVIASTHQTAAINRLNQTLPNVNQDNCSALFACASLITLNTFADAGTYTLEALMEIFGLLRGLNYILESAMVMLHEGPFAVLLEPHPNPPSPPAPLATMLDELRTACEPGGSPTSVPSDVMEATIAFRDCLEFIIKRSPHAELRAVMLYPIRLEAHFFDDLLSKISTDPATASLFLLYSRNLEYAASIWWFLSGWQNISHQIPIQQPLKSQRSLPSQMQTHQIQTQPFPTWTNELLSNPSQT